MSDRFRLSLHVDAAGETTLSNRYIGFRPYVLIEFLLEGDDMVTEVSAGSGPETVQDVYDVLEGVLDMLKEAMQHGEYTEDDE